MRGCHDLAYLDATCLSLDQVQVRLQLDGPRLPERNKDNSEPHWADSQQDEESLSARAALLQLKAALRTHKKHRTFCIANRSALSERVPQGNLTCPPPLFRRSPESSCHLRFQCGSDCRGRTRFALDGFFCTHLGTAIGASFEI